MKRRVLVVIGSFVPGYKAGGPVRTIVNLVENLGEAFDFFILTGDRDIGEDKPYPNIAYDVWHPFRGARIRYVPPHGFTFRTMIDVCKLVDTVYVCGVLCDYSLVIMLLKRMNLIRVPVTIAPMGVFSPKAFAIKKWKKVPYIFACRTLGLFNRITWSASTQMEADEIRTCAKNGSIAITRNLPRKTEYRYVPKHKEKGKLKIFFLSRIAEKKNLLYAIQVLKCVDSEVDFTIYGNITEAAYWAKCMEALKQLPPNIRWKYAGAVDTDSVQAVMDAEQLFLFPTLGENYGHVIQEALASGCPCLISDQTPWKKLESDKIGYAFPLQNMQEFVSAVQKYVCMDEREFQSASNMAVIYALSQSIGNIDCGYRMVFNNGAK